VGFQPKIDIVPIRFRGTTNFSSDGSPWRTPAPPNAKWPENVEYVGPPSRRLDDAWIRLIGPTRHSISEEEAKYYFGEKYVEYEDKDLGGYTARYAI
jgi:hypothetical protein